MHDRGEQSGISIVLKEADSKSEQLAPTIIATKKYPADISP